MALSYNTFGPCSWFVKWCGQVSSALEIPGTLSPPKSIYLVYMYRKLSMATQIQRKYPSRFLDLQFQYYHHDINETPSMQFPPPSTPPSTPPTTLPSQQKRQLWTPRKRPPSCDMQQQIARTTLKAATYTFDSIFDQCLLHVEFDGGRRGFSGCVRRVY